MIYIEAPEVYKDIVPSVFLAGGITGCWDWQAKATELLQDSDVAVLNPRRKDFPIDDPNAAYDQIKWEFDHLTKASVRLFWFTADTLQPIVLYELGRWAGRQLYPLIVGADVNYARYQDIKIQLCLARPGLPIYNDLEEMIAQLKKNMQLLPTPIWVND